MDNKLIKAVMGETRTRRVDQELTAEARKLVDEARLAVLGVDLSLQLGGVIMSGLVKLDAGREDLAAGNPMRDALLRRIEARALRQCEEIQEALFSPKAF
jgi:hypothetical protein